MLSGNEAESRASDTSRSTQKMVTLNDSAIEEDDVSVSALIYRESQLRKEEAAAAAAAVESKKTSSASTCQRTSTRKRSPVTKQVDTSLPNLQRKGAKRKRESSIAEDLPRKKAAKKKHRYECSADECTNHIVNRGLCVRHGATVKQCSSEGCTNKAVKGGVCIRHGAKVKRCSSEGCTNHVVEGGVCVRHDARIKRCSSEGCTTQAVKGGVCKRHGAHRNVLDESTAFGGSEFELTTATQTRSNRRASRVVMRGQEESTSVPEEVTIFCQEIVEV